MRYKFKALSALTLGLFCACSPPAARGQADQGATASEELASEGSDFPEPGEEERGAFAFDGAGFRSRVLQAQNIVLSLPGAESWVVLQPRAGWTGLGHQASGSEIYVRQVPARRTVSLKECEQEMRSSLSLLRTEGEEVESRPLSAPEGYGGVMRLMLFAPGGGRAEAFSVGVSRCLGVVFLSGEAPGFPERLGVAMGEILPALRLPNLSEQGLVPARTY